MASQKTLEHYLRQLRLIEEHREKWCEENVRRHYRDLDKDLKEFLGVQYAELAENDQLTYEILHKKGQYARFIEEVEQRINKFTPQASQDIKNTVQLTYKKCFEGMVDAVEKSKDYKELKINLSGVKAVTPDVVKNVVKNSFLEDALEKNHKTVIYDIKQQIGIGLTQGDRMSTMAKRISEQIDSDYKKSVRIARTECHRVREAGFQDSSQRISEKLQESGSDYVITKTWKTMQDMSVRPYRRKGKKGHKSFVMGNGPNHVKMQGVTVLVDEPFDLGDGYTAMTPGQSGIAGHDINCRCYVSRDLMTRAEFEKLTGRKIESKPVIKPKENEILETQEQALLDEKNNLEKEKEKYIKRQQNLETYQYDGIWKENVTPADYEAKKNKIQAKRDYFNQDILDAKNRAGKYANTSFYSDTDLNQIIKRGEEKLKMLDDFEAQGKTYLKLSKQVKSIDDRLLGVDDDIKAVRAQIMKAKGIDVKKMESEIDNLVVKIADMKKPNIDVDKDALKKLTFSIEDGWSYHTDPIVKIHIDDKLNSLKKEKAAGPITPQMQQYLDKLEDFVNEYKKLTTSNTDSKQLAKLQKQLKDKRDELDKIRKRYGLEDDMFSNARKNNAHWFDKANGGFKEADRYFDPLAKKIHTSATAAEQRGFYTYTSGSGGHNRPLAGFQKPWSKAGRGWEEEFYVGPKNVWIDFEGKGDEIRSLTTLIQESEYDKDVWLQSGQDEATLEGFLGIKRGTLASMSDKELQQFVGSDNTFYQFISCAINKGGGGCFNSKPMKLNIYAPKGSQMLYTSDVGAFGKDENEIILQRGGNYKITKIYRGKDATDGGREKIFVDMEIHPEKGYDLFQQDPNEWKGSKKNYKD